MKVLSKPSFEVTNIVTRCSESYNSKDLKERFISECARLNEMSLQYDKYAINGLWLDIEKHPFEYNVITKKEMINLYTNKFVKQVSVREDYYDKLILQNENMCPICGIGIIRNLDHYISKSLCPVYSVTPVNLVPICIECNFNKLDQSINASGIATFHPYYDREIVNYYWLCATVFEDNGVPVFLYHVNEQLIQDNDLLYKRLVHTIKVFKLAESYAIQSASAFNDIKYDLQKIIL